MNRFCPLLLTALVLPALAADPAPAPLFANDFEAVEVGQTPKEFLIIAGAFAVQKDGTNKVLELPGAPLDTFGVLFGAAGKEDWSASAKFFGTKQGRKFPTFGLSLNGAGGYRLQVSPAKKALEIYKGDEVRATVPLEWKDGSWTALRIQVRKSATGCTIEGKAWPADAAEPAKSTISVEDTAAPSAGRAGLWGSPYSGTPIRFDDLKITPAH